MIKHGKALALSINKKLQLDYYYRNLKKGQFKNNDHCCTLLHGVSCPFGHDTVEICDVQIVIVGHFFGDKGRDDDPLA